MPRSRTTGGRRVLQLCIGALLAVVALTAILAWPRQSPRGYAITEVAVINPIATTVGFSQPAELLSMSASDLASTMDAMVATGTRTVRVPIPWSSVEPVQGQRNWGQIDAVVNAANARSISVLGIIAFTPDWALASGAPAVVGKPASAAQFAAFAKAVATRYKATISTYEIWNEPNAALFFGPAPDANAYTQLLKSAYPAIKSVSSSITVIGGVLGSDIDSATVINPVGYLTAMYSAGAKNFFDAVSFHPYQYSLPFSDGVPIEHSPVNQVMEMRTIMVNNGDSGKKIWATEYGAPTSMVDEATQSSMISDFVTKWQELPYAGPIFIYTTRDKNSSSSHPEDRFGVFRSDGTPKQAQQSLQWLIANNIPKSAEFQRFAAVTNSAYGTVLSPVFRATETVWSQIRTERTLFETPSGFIASPNPVAVAARPIGVVPTGQFADGYQDFEYGLRVFYSAATGAHIVGGGIVAAWTPQLGLALTGEVPQPRGGVAVDFERGRITWTPGAGANVIAS